MRTLALLPILGLIAPAAMADISVSFIEGAPKDRFVITNTSCPKGPVDVTIDLRPSAGALIFDVTGAGAGVEVFQPFELVSGGALVTQVPTVQDGDQVLTLKLAGLGQGADVAFTIDLDDTIQSREITVADSEISGAKVIVEIDGQRIEGAFDTTASAVAPWKDCTS